MLMGRKLAVTLGFAGLLLVAFGAGCRGFFVAPTLTSITINPTAPSVQVGSTATIQAYGVNNDGSGAYLTSGVSWSSSDDTIVTVSGTGSATLTGLATGTATITASDESVTSTATATAFVTISAIAITPTSISLTTTDSAGAALEVYANNNSTAPADNLSATAIITVYSDYASLTIAPGVTCSYPGSGTTQLCTTSDATAGTYTAVATYTGSTLTAMATITVTN